MTRKDYIELAKIMNKLGRSIEAQSVESKAFNAAIDDITEWLAIDNPRFDSARFISALYGVK